jgi:hypothetical protein
VQRPASRWKNGVRSADTNGFYEAHPFKSVSGQLQDFISIFHQLRSLPANDLGLCLKTIREVAERNRKCAGCYGKGLAYLKFLTWGLDENAYESVAKDYRKYVKSSGSKRNYLLELEAIMARYGVSR